MSKDKSIKTVQIVPIDNGWILTCQEQAPPPENVAMPPKPPKVTQAFYESAAEACQAASEFLEPNVVSIVTGGN